MKLISFLYKNKATYGIVEGAQVLDLSLLLPQYPDLKSLLTNLDAATAAAPGAPRLNLADLELLPPIPNPAKIICIGKNYEDHRVEMGGGDRTEHPAVFLRFADTLVAHGQQAWVPQASTEVDYEGELAVIIGKPGRRISVDSALDHVAGYACFDEISIRDFQRHTPQFGPGKNFPRTGGFGPWLVTADEVPNPQTLAIETRLNGQIVQSSTTAEMIFSVAELIAYCSQFTPLSTGDIISTGTPSGVGVKRKPQLFLKAGDMIEVEIASIGVLCNTMVAEP